MRIPSARAIFDLEHLDGLSDAPSLLLIVSERTLYLLQNLVTLDTADHVRYAIERYGEGEYVSVVEGDAPEWLLFSAVADHAAQEIIEAGKMPLYGITEAIGTQDIYAVPGAGNYQRAIGPVPEGELWEIQSMDASYSGASVASIQFKVISEWTDKPVHVVDAPAPYTHIGWNGRIVIGPGQQARIDYYTVSAGATLVSRWWFCKLVQ